MENSLEEGAAGREVAAVVELPLLKHGNQLTASSPRSSYTPPVAHLSPDMAMYVSRDKSSLPTRGSSPPACLIMSQRSKQPSWEMPRAWLLSLPPCLLSFASAPVFPCALGLPACPCSPHGRHVPLINELHLHPKLITLSCQQRMRQLHKMPDSLANLSQGLDAELFHSSSRVGTRSGEAAGARELRGLGADASGGGLLLLPGAQQLIFNQENLLVARIQEG